MKNIVKQILLVGLIALLQLCLGSVAIAQEDKDEAPKTETKVAPRPKVELKLPFLPAPDGVPKLAPENAADPDEIRDSILNEFLPRIGQILLTVTILAAFGMLIFSGFKYFTSFGDEDAGSTAKRTAIFAIVGLLIAFVSLIVVQLINRLPLT